MTDLYFQMTFDHRNGSHWHPALVSRRGTSVKAYRLGRPGKGSNRLENTTFVEAGDEQRMIDLVLEQNYLVRCKDKTQTANMFGIGKRTRSIDRVLLDGKMAWSRQGD
jgi:hypothetical protein